MPPGSVVLPERSPGRVSEGAAAGGGSKSAGTASRIVTFDLPTPRCGPLTLRYVQLVPSSLGGATHAPVLILLHDSGQSAERLRIQQTSFHFDELAQREGLVLVYANAAPSRATDRDIRNSGGWQTDDAAHPEIDDQRYLLRLLADLAAHGVIAGGNDVYLIGFGGGARMALSAAAARPDDFTGVAAFLARDPGRLATPLVDLRARRLARVLFVHYQGFGRDFREPSLQAAADGWAIGLGISALVHPSDPEAQRPPRPFERRPLKHDVEGGQWDLATPTSGGAAVRVLVLERRVPLFPASVSARHGSRKASLKSL